MKIKRLEMKQENKIRITPFEKVKFIIMLTVFLWSFQGCLEKSETSDLIVSELEDSVPLTDKVESITNAKNKIFESGDTAAYNFLKVQLKNSRDLLFFWSLNMSNKYDYAHLDVVNLILDCYVKGESSDYHKIDNKTKFFLENYLEKSLSEGNEDAKQLELALLYNPEEPLFKVTENPTDLKSKVLSEGDTSAYQSLKWEYTNFPAEGFLFWAMVMANKYDYTPAYFDVYSSIFENSYVIGDSGFVKLSIELRELGEEYLNIAKQRSSHNPTEE